MALRDLIHGKTRAGGFATAIPAIPATADGGEGRGIARIATVAVATPANEEAPRWRHWRVIRANGEAFELFVVPASEARELAAHYPGARVEPIK